MEKTDIPKIPSGLSKEEKIEADELVKKWGYKYVKVCKNPQCKGVVRVYGATKNRDNGLCPICSPSRRRNWEGEECQ